MCGICGFVSQQEITTAEEEVVRVINHSLRHRGPDGTGEYCNEHIAMAMCRLSIIDLEGGWQPIYNEDRSLVLIANGEIYNYIELRRTLQAKGHHFSTTTDCEVILHLYEENGADCVQDLRGMFAFALWDENSHRLMLARDRMGEKPMYLYERAEALIFASELRTILQSALIPLELDPAAVDLYFHYQYVPEPLTPITGLRKLEAGHFLLIEVEPWRVTDHCYWAMEDAPPIEGDPVELIRNELETIASLVIRADVPVGIALSGGLDSSAIASLAVSKYPDTMHAFSVGYPGNPPHDERDDARALARHLRMPFHEIELHTEDLVDLFPELVYWSDDPIADIAGYGYYAVMKLAHEHNVPVILQGQGGDELFWGYPWVRQAVDESVQKSASWEKKWRGITTYLSLCKPENLSGQAFRAWASSWAGLRPGWQRFRRHQTAPYEQMAFYDLSPGYSYFSTQAHKMYDSMFTEKLQSQAASLFTFPHPWHNIDVRITSLISSTFLRENGIAQADRLSMASSVELRLPLVDHRLIEVVIGLRKHHSDHQLQPKAWLKTALEDIVPDWVINKPKRGFEPPARDWYNAIFARYDHTLSNGFLVDSGVINPDYFIVPTDTRLASKGELELRYKAVVLEAWCRKLDSLHH